MALPNSVAVVEASSHTGEGHDHVVGFGWSVSVSGVAQCGYDRAELVVGGHAVSDLADRDADVGSVRRALTQLLKDVCRLPWCQSDRPGERHQ